MSFWINSFDPSLRGPIGNLLAWSFDQMGNYSEVREIFLLTGQPVHVKFTLIPMQHIFIPPVHAPVEMPRMVNFPSIAPSLPLDFAACTTGSSTDAEVTQPSPIHVDAVDKIDQSDAQPAKEPTEVCDTVNQTIQLSEPCCSTDPVDTPVSPPSSSQMSEKTKSGKSKRRRNRKRKPISGNNFSQKSVPGSSTSTHVPRKELSTSQLYSLSEVGLSYSAGSLTPNRLPGEYFKPLREQQNHRSSDQEKAFSRFLSRVATGNATVQRKDYDMYGQDQDYSRTHSLPDTILKNLQNYNLIISETNATKLVKKNGREYRKKVKNYTIKIPLRVEFKNGILYHHPDSQGVTRYSSVKNAVFEIGIAKNGKPFHTFLRIFDKKPKWYFNKHLNASERIEFEQIIKSTNTEDHELMFDFINGDRFTVFRKP